MCYVAYYSQINLLISNAVMILALSVALFSLRECYLDPEFLC